MNNTEAIHTAARRYCEERALDWVHAYDELRASERRERERRGVPEPVAYTYSPQALRTFPRYHVLHAILFEVERFVPGDFASLDEARSLIAAAGETAESVFTRPPHGEIEQETFGEERAAFTTFVLGLSERDLELVEPLPFRRRLQACESAQIRSELKLRWGVDRYWYPLDRALDADPPAETMAFRSEAVLAIEVQERLRTILASCGVSRVFELREHDADGPDSEIDLALLETLYTGAEGFWTDGSFEWVLYASHEGSVTIAGSEVLRAFQAAFPASGEWLYHG